MKISISKSISSSIALPIRKNFNGVFGFSVVLTSLPFETETMVDEAGLVVKTRIGPTKGRLREVLTVSKIDIPPKIDVHTRIFTIRELTSAKIGANVADVDKIGEKTGKLTVHTAGGFDIPCALAATVDDSVTKEVACSSVDEVLDTSIVDTWS